MHRWQFRLDGCVSFALDLPCEGSIVISFAKIV